MEKLAVNYFNVKNQTSKLHREWHLAHKMPKSATLEQRIAWHVEHKKNCACRDIPEKLKLEMKKRLVREFNTGA